MVEYTEAERHADVLACELAIEEIVKHGCFGCPPSWYHEFEGEHLKKEHPALYDKTVRCQWAERNKTAVFQCESCWRKALRQIILPREG